MKIKYATRTVLLDDEGRVAILHVRKHGYYKIPGGGVEEGEDLMDAARREVMEEAGCDCDIVGELGQMTTEVSVWDMVDISDGFVAKVVGEKLEPKYEEWESERGFELVWLDSLDAAIEMIEKNAVKEPGMECLQGRDLGFLKRARGKVEQE